MPFTPEFGAHDIGQAGLDAALARSDNPALLRRLVSISRRQFGWFSRRSSRADEYVWVADLVGRGPPARIADIGAGVSPLPILLAGHGHAVVTIDGSDIARIPGQGEREWDGWGYLDYAALNGRISSINRRAGEAMLAAGSLDACYSVSVVEHMAAGERRALCELIAGWTRAGADLLLTVDLVPGTDDLWNMNQGRVVESLADHGSFGQLAEEVERAGFRVAAHSIRRGYADRPVTDLGLLHGVRV